MITLTITVYAATPERQYMYDVDMQKEHTWRRAFGYARVSTSVQGRDGESLGIQQELIEAICKLEGLRLESIFVDEVSGSKPFGSRPQGKKLLSALQSGDVIIALRLDRAFRDTADALRQLKELKRRGVDLYLRDVGGFISGDSVGTLVFSLMSAVASFERSRTRERIIEVRQSMRKQDRYLGGDTPFGHRVVERGGDRYIEADARLLDEVSDLKRKGYSTRLIAGHFAERGVYVSHHAVARCIRRMAQQTIG